MFEKKYNDIDSVLDLMERIVDIITKLFSSLLGGLLGGNDEAETSDK